MPAKSNAASSKDSSAHLGFEAKLWLTADKLRNNMDAAEYKHVVLGLIFLKYISDTFEEHRAKQVAGQGDYVGANPEDPDEPSFARQTAVGSPKGERPGANQYKAENVFWVPAEARWPHLQAMAKQPVIGKIVDDAMVAIERDNSRLKGVLPKDYARPGLDKQRLGELIDVIATIELTAASEGEKTHRSVDLLGRVYEYFLTRFASAEGKNGGQFYTLSSVVRLLVEMLAPYKGRIYDPACGSGGMFVQSEKFVEAHGGKLGDISIYGQDKRARRKRSFGPALRARRVRLGGQPKQRNATTRRLAVMNLVIRGIEADFGEEHADIFRRDLHPDLRADLVIADPPFNDSDWFHKDDDVRWSRSEAETASHFSSHSNRRDFGIPPKGNANFVWVQHFIHHLAPAAPGSSGGMAGFVLANGSMSSNQSGEKEICKALIEADLVDCMVALPAQFLATNPFQILPVTMYRAFNIINCEWRKLTDKSADTTHASNKRSVKESLDSFINDGIVDGTKLGAKWFPSIKADVFISHAHDDEDSALRCASWLKSNFGLESFIDSCVWGHADDLLKMIDNKYCLNDGRGTYSYEKRNQSTGHVHMMLVTALTEMIDAAECTFFINTLNSITSEEAISKTKSPWLFYELGVMRTLRRKIPPRLRNFKENFSYGTTKKAAELKVEYVVPLSELTQLSSSQLNTWREQSKSKMTQGVGALDLLYENCPETK